MDELEEAARRAVATVVGSSAVTVKWTTTYESDVAAFMGEPYAANRGVGEAPAKTCGSPTEVVIFGNAKFFAGRGRGALPLIEKVFAHEGFHARMILANDDCTGLLYKRLGEEMTRAEFYPWLAGICLNEARVERALAEAGIPGPIEGTFPGQIGPNVGPDIRLQQLALFSAYGAHRGPDALLASWPLIRSYANRDWRAFVETLASVPGPAVPVGLELQRASIDVAAQALERWRRT
jgi:hypothetical protein